MIWLYWAIRRHIEHRRSVSGAMREMRRYGYRAEWHGMIEPRRRNWDRFAV